MELPSQGGYYWGSENEGAMRPTCDWLEGLDDVFVVVKTGANEAPEKLPAHFRTTLSCIPHYGIWSDLEEDIAGHHVSDALDEMDPDIVANHPDFEYYRQLREKGTGGFSSEQLTTWTEAQNTASGRDTPGWKLDKWKFLPLAEKAYRQRPEARWFVLMECDTFVIWRNLLAWLSTLDSSQPLYLGHQMQIGDVVFAYGGAGIVISNSAMRKLVEYYASNRAFYDDFTAHHWAGDCVLGKAMADAGVNLKWSWPTLLGDLIADVNFKSTFGSSSARPWCYHATSYHHLTPSDVMQYDSFEKTWREENPNKLLRHGDVFRHFVLPKLQTEIEDWDNESTDEQHDAESIRSPADCRRVCEGQPECVQFSLKGQSCRMSNVIKLGHEHRHQRKEGKNPISSSNGKEEKEEQRVMSGWLVDRVAAFVDEMDASCEGEDWIVT
ncbi:hypothetical protein DL770_006803 [Monosporascus sp. CRB-9-2]|nr:hypothetical protein DL770_006803 [Monosporascus sp. CRB-9-2]